MSSSEGRSDRSRSGDATKRSSRRSVQRRLTVFLLLGCGALFLLTGLILERAIVRWLEADFDRALERRAEALVALSEQEDGEVELDFVADLMPEFASIPGAGHAANPDQEPEEETPFFELWLHRDDGGLEVFGRSPSLRDSDLETSPGVSREPRFRDATLPGSVPGREVQVDFVPQVETEDDENEERDAGEGGEDAGEEVDDVADEGDDPTGITGLDPAAPPPGARVATLVVAQPTEGLSGRIAYFRSVLLGGGLLILLTLALLVHLAVRRGLRPLRELTRQVDSLDADRLDQRIEIEPPPELETLVSKLNELLRRLASAFERERHFSSDVAHELRTPIAELRSLAEVGCRWPDDAVSVRRFFGDAQEIAEQMERVVTQLLAVARSEAGMEVTDPERVHFASLLSEVVERHREAARRRSVELTAEVPGDVWLHSDAAKLHLVLHNALDNAVAYTPAGGEICVAGEEAEHGFVLAVANPVEGLEEPDLEHVFDRFWRKEEARSRAGSSGLGLALVRSLCELMGVEVDASLEGDADPPDRFVLRLVFPPEIVVGELRRRAS